mmetsp:Transcript_54285/g.112739  ORF Transcript_54285/g.112739 Transcript_54285/m.112739 type:complete len:228 (+) Transcript_54285:24-707(+)
MSLGLDSDGSASAPSPSSKGQGGQGGQGLAEGFASTPLRRGRLTPLPLTLPRERLLGGAWSSRPGTRGSSRSRESCKPMSPRALRSTRLEASTWQESLLRSSLDWGWMSTQQDLTDSVLDDEVSFAVIRQHVGHPPCHHCIATVYDRHFERQKDKAEQRLPRQLKPNVRELLRDIRAFQYPRRRNIQHEIREKEIRPPSRQSPTPRTQRTLVGELSIMEPSQLKDGP